MKIHQLSVFVENKPGRLRPPCDVLAKAGINIVTLCLADTQQYGILRMIVRDWQQAKAVLEAAGFVVKITEVLAVEVPDHPGGLAELLHVIEGSGMNVEYMYAFAEKLLDKAVLVFRFEDADAAAKALAESRVTVIGDIDLFSRGESSLG
jgi:hypothetical protein